MTTWGYDVIGDIHGHHAKLDALLRKLGYLRRAGTWVPPSGRQAVFVGDVIDRGPQQVEACQAVRSMVDAGHARAILGNHEFNAIGYVTQRAGGAGEFLRPHSPKNVRQHAEFLAQVGEGSPLHRELVGWFGSLPATLDLGGLRVVHAWWHAPYVDCVKAQWAQGRSMGEDFLHAAWTEGTAEWRAMDGLTKGLAVALPAGCSVPDHEGHERQEVRVRWWQDAPRELADVALVPPGQERRLPPGQPLPQDYPGAAPDGPPVVIGHYWMRGTPVPLGPRVACVDWSAARDGPLVAYRWAGEPEIDPTHFVTAG